MMEKIVAANDFGVGIGEKGEGVVLRLAKVRGDFGRVDADGDGPNTLRGELGKIVLDAS